MRQLIIIAFLVFLVSQESFAQENWTLNRCVEYAIKNNIELNRKYNQVDYQQITLTESKINVLPDLNMGTGLSMSYGRNIDGVTNSVTFDQTFGNDYWLQSSINLFQGLVKYNTIGFQNFLFLAIQEEAQYQTNRLTFDIMTAYYTVLYSQGLVSTAQKQVSLSEMQFTRMQKLVDVGKESPLMVQELKSQWANDKLNLTIAENNYRRKLLDLKQLLRLNASFGFELDTLNIAPLVINPLPAIDSVYENAQAVLPEIKQLEYLVKASEKDLAISKGYISPRVNLRAGFGTNYFDGDTLGFSTQLNNNQNQWINMGIVIPIFNGASTYSQIKRKEIAVLNRELELAKRQEDLYTEIWKAVDDLQSAENEYESSVELNEFSRLTLKNVSMKLEKGMASATDYEAAKQRLVSSEAGLLKARMVYVMRAQMLDFYKTGSWEHL